MDIRIEKTTAPKQIPASEDVSNIVFGTKFTDHMFLMDYTTEEGWHDARIVPFGPISLSPAACGLHYGQLIFEGMKAYRTAEGKIVMFRPDQNMARMNISCDRMCIPPIDEGEMVKAIAKLVEIDADWVPSGEGQSLYVRPFIFATEPFLGVHPSHSFTFCVILSPVAAYYAEGLAPVNIYVENKYVRAVRGGTGFTKCAGNYANGLKAQVEAQAEGYSQILWLDGVEQKYIEEVGAMNVCFVIDGKVVTPELNGSILPGITRKSVLEVLKRWNIPASEEHVSIEDFAKKYDEGLISEVFGTGTAAVISPVGELKWNDKVMKFNNGEIGELSQKLYDEITGIQTGKREDPDHWVYVVKE